MKLNKWLYGAAALAMLAACSDKDIAPGSGGDDNGSQETQFASGKSYMGISIQLPTEPITRAADAGDQGNDNFDDGTPTEYNVDNAAILLFIGKTEATAKFVGAYTLLEDETFDEPSNDNITTSFHRTIQILNKPVIADNDTETLLWGLALVNYREDHFEIYDDIETKGTYGDLIVKGSFDGGTNGIKLARVKDGENDAYTFESFRNLITTCKFLNNKKNTETLKSIFMTNAPLSNKKGTSVQPDGAVIQTLAKLDYKKFKETEAAAQEDPAGCIFVERAVAKVTCSEFPTSTTLSHAEIDENGKVTTTDVKLNIDYVGWMIDNEEKTSYVVRNAKTDDVWWQYQSSATSLAKYGTRYRFIGGTNMNDRVIDGVETEYDDNTDIHKVKFRTYWCRDPKYSDDKNFEEQATSTATYAQFVASGTSKWASPSALYPHENTFDIDHQNYKNTTRVVFKVQYSVEGSTEENPIQLYAIRGQLKNFYLENDAKNLLRRGVVGSNEIPELIRTYKKTDLAFADIPYDQSSFDFTWGTATAKDAENSEKGLKEGDCIITGLTFSESFITQYFKELTPTDKTAINNELDEIRETANSAYHIVKFKDNVCYYAVNIQHFGDTYCALPEGWKGETVDKVYVTSLTDNTKSPTSYLGRYGMVRNNWYDLQIGTIGRLGNADVPDGNVNTSDDNEVDECYLSARIHVLSWAKRTQKHDF